MNERVKEVMELLSDEDFANEVVTESVEETQANLKAKGYDYSIDELMELAENVSVNDVDGEMAASSLEQVSGGCWHMPRIIPRIIRTWRGSGGGGGRSW